MTAAELNKTLNLWGRPALPAVAAQGEGVIETLRGGGQEMLAAIAVKYNLKEKGLDPASVPGVVETPSRRRAEERGRGARPRPPPSPRRARPRSWSRSQTDSLHAAPPQTGRRRGSSRRSSLHRSIRSNVELAESLSGLVREMNLGLAAILTQAELLMFYREDDARKAPGRHRRHPAGSGTAQEGRGRPRRSERSRGGGDERSAGIDALRHLRAHDALFAFHGDPGPRGIAPATVRAPLPAAAPAPAVMAAPVATANGSPHEAAPGRPGRRAGGARRPEMSRGARASLRRRSCRAARPPRCGRPSREPWKVIVTSSFRGTQLSLRCERKPVLLKGRDGEVKRDFLMLALAHTGNLSPEDQQRVMQGIDPGPSARATRLFREMGGFVRFALSPAARSRRASSSPSPDLAHSAPLISLTLREAAAYDPRLSCLPEDPLRKVAPDGPPAGTPADKIR